METIISDLSEITKIIPNFNINNVLDMLFLLKHFKVKKSLILEKCRNYGYILDFLESKNCIDDIDSKLVDTINGKGKYTGPVADIMDLEWMQNYWGYNTIDKKIDLDNKIVPTHKCIECGALWTYFPVGDTGYSCGDTWHLFSDKCGICCDNQPMKKQIQPLTVKELMVYLQKIYK